MIVGQVPNSCQVVDVFGITSAIAHNNADHDGLALNLSGVVNECGLSVNQDALKRLEGFAVKQDAAQWDHAGRFAGDGIGELFGCFFRARVGVEKVVFDFLQDGSFLALTPGRENARLEVVGICDNLERVGLSGHCGLEFAGQKLQDERRGGHDRSEGFGFDDQARAGVRRFKARHRWLEVTGEDDPA